MVIIKFMGGLGNQMFQYALYEKFKSKGVDVKADLAFYRTQDKVKYSLNVFQIDLEEASKHQIETLSGQGTKIINKLLRKLKLTGKNIYMEDFDVHFEPEVLELKKAYLDGYWQSEKYFLDIRDVILEKFTFPQSKLEKNQEILHKIRNTESVSLHIRRGDYLQGRAKQLYGDICTIDYYNTAIEYISAKVNNPFFYIFSDDIEWVKEEIKVSNAVYIDWNAGVEDYYDMYLMSCCKYNIIANSSFSWWAAWLNTNKDKIVISPSHWFNLDIHTAPDIICEDWVKIEC